jgi:hypothetical protein
MRLLRFARAEAGPGNPGGSVRLGQCAACWRPSSATGWRVALAPGKGNRMTVALLPPSATRDARLLLLARGPRAATDGCVSVVLPAYLLLLGSASMACRWACWPPPRCSARRC